MLSDEEKEAINEVKHFKELTRYWQEEEYEEKEIAGYIGIVLNLIKKQSKEIEELKANKGYHLGFIDGGIAKRYEYEDKIKAKIEELEKQDKESKLSHNYLVIPVLQSLLKKE